MTSTNIQDNEIKQLALEKRFTKKKTKAEQDKQIAEWQMFYLNNLDIFTEDYLGIPLHYFQRTLLLDTWKYDIMDIIASRGISKSFTISIMATDLALLLPGVNILLTSLTLGQSNKIIDEKIDVLLSSKTKGISPVLKQLRQEGFIKFGKSDTGDAKVVEFGNGSKIYSACCGESTRGSRANIVIVDESRLIKKTDYDSIIEPTLEPYYLNGLRLETKQFFITSARAKNNWMWKHLRNTVSKHYTDKNIKYGFFAGDIFTAVANNVQTKNQLIARRDNTNELDFLMEYCNIFLGESEGALFSYDAFTECQVLEHAFIPRTGMEVLENVEQKYNFDNEFQTRAIAMDIAVVGGSSNDNTVFTLGLVDTETSKKHVEYVKSYNGMNVLNQVIIAKRLFYEYKAKYFIIDSKGIGSAMYDLFTTETFDPEYNKTYPAWTVNSEPLLQLSSDSVIKEKANRAISSETEDVIVPFTGTSERNSEAHLSVKKSIGSKTLKLLIDDGEKESFLVDKEAKFVTLNSEEKARQLIPFVETRFMINEAVSLTAKITDKGVKVEEQRSDTKDRYMSLAMFSLFADNLLGKIAKETRGDVDVNVDDWKFLQSMCQF